MASVGASSMVSKVSFESLKSSASFGTVPPFLSNTCSAPTAFTFGTSAEISSRQLASQHRIQWKGIVLTAIYRRGREGIVDDIGLPEEEEDVVGLPPEPKPGYHEQNESDSFFDGVDDSRRYSWHEAGRPGNDEADVGHEETGGGRYINMLLLFLNSLRIGQWRSSGFKGVLHLVVVWGNGVSQTCQDALFASLPLSVPPDLIKSFVNGFFLLVVLWLSKLVIDVLFKVGGFILAAVIVAAFAQLISQHRKSKQEVRNGSKRESHHENSFNFYDQKRWTPKKRKPPNDDDYFGISMFGAA